MIQRIRDYFAREFDQETPKSRMVRVRYGLVIGVIGAFVYALVSATVNVISYPGLHLTVNWGGAITSWIVVSLALALAGFIVGWPTEEVKAIVGGGVTLTIVLLLANTIAFLVGNTGGVSYFQVLVASLPMIGVCVLAALALRQGINRIAGARDEEDKAARHKRFLKIIRLVVLIGAVGGFFNRLDNLRVTMLDALNKLLQSTDITSASMVKFPENVLVDVQSVHPAAQGTRGVFLDASRLGSNGKQIRFPGFGEIEFGIAWRGCGASCGAIPIVRSIWASGRNSRGFLRDLWRRCGRHGGRRWQQWKLHAWSPAHALCEMPVPALLPPATDFPPWAAARPSAMVDRGMR